MKQTMSSVEVDTTVDKFFWLFAKKHDNGDNGFKLKKFNTYSLQDAEGKFDKLCEEEKDAQN